MFGRIVLATDGTEAGDVALSFTIALAREHRASVRVVHVNEVFGRRRRGGPTVESDAAAADIVARAVGELTDAGIATDGLWCRATCFSVADRLADAAHDWAADAIVLGSERRRRPWARLRGAGVRERVTAMTGVPTLVAPAPLAVSPPVDRPVRPTRPGSPRPDRQPERLP